ncbi:sporulation protein YhbH [Paenibacillus sp. N4]|uniref:sporulation protein YhbH n=1 Tax=Paenibacillus vietnamensis TaxID=2590547 RepID=UPI001CD16E5C|nr:sporulation protein YhbH [Paenibacillus vietnamensis]MCA0758734.1 sporulation protein YhbH [Paenibacillus vietnamensis]
MHESLFVLSQEDWSLHRKGELDQQRHSRRIKEAIKNNLSDLVSEESIITSQGGRILKVPIRGMDEPRFRYDYSGKKQVGQGAGGTKVGDVVGQAAPDGQKGSEERGQAGDQPGVDYYEAEITVDELAELIFEDLQLPRLKPKSEADLTVDDIRFNDIRRKGMMGNIDKRRTLMEAMKRRALSGPGGAGPSDAAAAYGQPARYEGESEHPYPSLITNEDLRFKTWEDIRKPQSAALVLAMMDTSGSMGTFEKYLARSFYFWMVRFLRTKYEQVQVCFLAHDTEAKQVDEQAFFTKGESGGTRCSSVYRLALELLETQYPSQYYNAYAFHFSDGDNLDSDNIVTTNLVRGLLDKVNMLGYGEIRRQGHGGRLWDAMSAVPHEAFIRSVLREKGDVYRTLKDFFGEADAS